MAPAAMSGFSSDSTRCRRGEEGEGHIFAEVAKVIGALAKVDLARGEREEARLRALKDDTHSWLGSALASAADGVLDDGLFDADGPDEAGAATTAATSRHASPRCRPSRPKPPAKPTSSAPSRAARSRLPEGQGALRQAHAELQHGSSARTATQEEEGSERGAEGLQSSPTCSSAASTAPTSREERRTRR